MLRNVALAAPERTKRVKVLHPYQVFHDGKPYWADAVVEVPKSLADQWIKNLWVTDV